MRVLVVVLTAFAISIASASDKSKAARANLYTLEAARFVLCTEAFDERTLGTYLQATNPTRYQAYAQAREFDPAKSTTLLNEARTRLQQEAAKSFEPSRTYELQEVEMLAGGYDADRQGFWLSVPEAVSYYSTDSRRSMVWPVPYSSSGIPQTTVRVALDYPTAAPFAFDERGFMFVPVPPSAAQDFARQYPDSIAGLGPKPSLDPYTSRPHPPNVTDTGARKIFADLNVSLIGCQVKSQQSPIQDNSLTARVTGIRLHVRYARDLKAGRLFYEWNEDAPTR